MNLLIPHVDVQVIIMLTNNRFITILTAVLFIFLILAVSYIVSESLISYVSDADTSLNEINKQTTEADNIHVVNNYLLVSIVILSLLSFVSILITFYLYRWRKILLSKPHMLLPEDTGKHLNQLTESIIYSTRVMDSNYKNLKQQTLITAKNVKDISEHSNSKIDDIADMFLTLHKTLDEKDAEIKRLKNGYDKDIFKKFIFRFIRVDQAVSYLLDEGEDESLKQIRKLLKDAFSECDIEIIKPNIGDDYKKTFGVADNPKIIKSEQPGDEFKISEIVEEGYLINTPNGNEVLLPAKVKVFGAYINE